MAPTGKIPLLGFKAGARKFLTLLGFSPPTLPPGSSGVITARVRDIVITMPTMADFDVSMARFAGISVTLFPDATAMVVNLGAWSGGVTGEAMTTASITNELARLLDESH